MSLPSALLYAISQPQGHQVTLVLGAGCSYESPPGLPLAHELAKRTHDILLADKILDEGECLTPDDLTVVTDTVFNKRGAQWEVVRRFPRNAFRDARPNEGYKIAAALMAEEAVGAVLTLNFDLAISNALRELDLQSRVSVIARPDDLGDFGAVNVIYLHRSVQESDWESWVLRTDMLDKAWRDGWQEMFAMNAMSAPVTVFAGLGSPATVLTESAKKLKAALPGSDHYLVDPKDKSDSEFCSALGLSDEKYIQKPWGEFMDELSNRVVEEHRTKIHEACQSLIAVNGWDTEDVDGLCQRVADQGLTFLGKLRGRWCMKESVYADQRSVDPLHFADLLLTVGTLERLTGSSARFRDDGVVEFWEANHLLGAVAFAHGRGVIRWTTCKNEVTQYLDRWQNSVIKPTAVIVAGVVGENVTDLSTPDNLISDMDEPDIISVKTIEVFVDVDWLRASPDEVARRILNG